MRRITFLLTGLLIICESIAQTSEERPFAQTDTLLSEPVTFTVSSASEYIIGLLGTKNLWRPSGDTMRLSLTRLIGHSYEPFDSVQNRLSRFNYDSVKYRHSYILHHDTIPLRWLNDSTFFIDIIPLERDPLIIKETVIKKAIDTSSAVYKEFPPAVKNMIDSVMLEEETLTEIKIDTFFLESKDILLYKISDNGIIPPVITPNSGKSTRFISDSARIIISDTVNVIVADKKSPFYLVPGTKMTDSLRHAVRTLLSYTYNRDSILLFINDLHGRKTPFWLTSSNDELYRYWVKNYKNDSITIWMGNPAKHDITLILEEDVNVNRLVKENADDIPITVVKPERSLVKTEPLKIIPVYWNYIFSSTFGLNETFHSYWAKGGENSLSGLFEIKGIAKYTNTEVETQWTSSGRFKYGAIITDEYGFRTNNDMLEFNSQFNKVIKEKIDFSTIFFGKTQVSNGYNYPNDSVVISKFLNPGTFTIGFGLEYKPSKKMQINFSMLSYKNTFVLDTSRIDPTRHGIAKNKTEKKEMGGQLTINNTISPLEGLNITNALRFFSGYLDKPGNIDVDWEMNLEKKIKWYFKILLNFHVIYDDDILLEVLDKNKKPILLGDGSKKKSPKIQFKQFLGLTFTF